MKLLRYKQIILQSERTSKGEGEGEEEGVSEQERKRRGVLVRCVGSVGSVMGTDIHHRHGVRGKG